LLHKLHTHLLQPLPYESLSKSNHVVIQCGHCATEAGTHKEHVGAHTPAADGWCIAKDNNAGEQLLHVTNSMTGDTRAFGRALCLSNQRLENGGRYNRSAAASSTLLAPATFPCLVSFGLLRCLLHLCLELLLLQLL
jgi:hypothetical protein